MSLPKYPEYKPSGVQWLGDVPAHWEVGPLKRAVALVESGVSVNAVDEPAGPGMVGVLKTSAVYSGRFEPGENKAVVAEDLDRVACPVKAGTLIVSRMNTPSLVGAAGLVADDVENLFLPDRLWQVHLAGALPQFVHFWTLSPSYRAQVQMACAGTSASMQNLSQDEFLRFVLPLPSLEEQTAIAHFLDHETAKIDALIAEQEKLIHLLAEKRQATLSHAVTRGLDPAAPMKDSGVAWLGEVPAHWEILTFQRCVYVQEGQVDPENEPFRSMILIAPNHVESGTGRILGTETAQEQAAESGKYLCKSGDVIYSKIRPALRKVCIAPEDCLCSADMYPLRGIAGLSNSFLMWFMLSEPFSALAVLESERVAMPKINRESLKAVWVPVPSLQEQVKISTFLAQETTRLDTLRAEAERAIALLKERRAALIAAAVTGQIDVRQNSEILNGGEARDAVAALS